MTEAKALKIFKKYNPEDAVKRCPNGRAIVRKQLDIYARAAVNLYGVIPIAEFVEIFNSQNSAQTDTDETVMLLLPLILKSKWYCFYKGYIVHYWAIDNFDRADYWILEQGDKPRYIPEKDEFLEYEYQYYECEKQRLNWKKILDFILEEWSDSDQKYGFYNILKETTKFSMGISEIEKLIDEYGLAFSNEKQAQQFFSLLAEARNNTKLWFNKGYSPAELREEFDRLRPKSGSRQIVVQKRIKIGANDPCPCGSGKKYKKCCRLTEQAQTAQLSQSECNLFYETWYGLMGYINKQKKIIDAVIKPVYPNSVGDDLIYKVREVLWANPNIISDYLDSAKLSEEKVRILKSWRDYHKKGSFFLAEYKPDYAIVIAADEQKEDRLYAVKGISRSLSDVMQRELPIQLETVLLPFKDKIIYDSLMNLMPVVFVGNAKKELMKIYENAHKHGIITKLD